MYRQVQGSVVTTWHTEKQPVYHNVEPDELQPAAAAAALAGIEPTPAARTAGNEGTRAAYLPQCQRHSQTTLRRLAAMGSAIIIPAIQLRYHEPGIQTVGYDVTILDDEGAYTHALMQPHRAHVVLSTLASSAVRAPIAVHAAQALLMPSLAELQARMAQTALSRRVVGYDVHAVDDGRGGNPEAEVTMHTDDPGRATPASAAVCASEMSLTDQHTAAATSQSVPLVLVHDLKQTGGRANHAQQQGRTLQDQACQSSPDATDAWVQDPSVGDPSGPSRPCYTATVISVGVGAALAAAAVTAVVGGLLLRAGHQLPHTLLAVGSHATRCLPTNAEVPDAAGIAVCASHGVADVSCRYACCPQASAGVCMFSPQHHTARRVHHTARLVHHTASSLCFYSRTCN
jgi:hypothetical protein